MTENNKKIDFKKIFSISNPKFFNALKMAIAILIALVLTFIVLCFLSKDPVNALLTILTGPLSKPRYLGAVISRTIPYAFAGLAAGVLFKSGALNLGAEGIFVISGVAIAAVACSESLMSLGALHPFVCVLVGAVTGGILMLIPAILKAKFNTNEMVVSLMLNSIYSGVAMHIIRKYLLTTTTSTVGSKDYMPTSMFGYIYEPLKITACLFILILAVVILYLVMNKSKLGYQIRIAGVNPKFAKYSGINAFSLSLKTAAIAGILAGIGSACQMLTQSTFYQPDKTCAGIGFSGMLLAMLGKNNPIAIVVATFLIQYLENGTNVLYFIDQSIPAEIVAIVEGIVILLISSQYFLMSFREKKLLKEGLNQNVK